MATAANQPILSAVRLSGERVTLRPTRAADAAAAFPLIHDQDEVLRWIVWTGPETVDELARIYATWRRRGETGVDYTLAILERATGAFQGSIVLRYAAHSFTGDVGYWIAREAWGRGLASEAVALVAHLAFEHLSSVLLVAQTHVDNHPSVRVLEKSGFRIDVETTVERPGGPRRELHLSLGRNGWRTRAMKIVPAVDEVALDAGPP